MIIINDTIFRKTVTRPYPVLVMSLFNVGFFRKDIWKNVLPVNFAIKGFLTIDADVYYTDDYLLDLPEEVTTKMFANEKVFLDIKKKTLLAEKNFIAAKKKSHEEFFQAMLQYVPALGIYHTCDDLIENKLRETISEKTSLTETNELIDVINIPLIDNFSTKMRLELLKDGVKGLDKCIKKYSWINSRYGKHKFYAKEELINILTNLKKENYLQEYEKKKQVIKVAIKRAKQLLGDKGYYVDVMQFFVYYRTQRTDIFNKHLFEYHDQLVQLAAELDISYEQLLACTYPEMRSKNIPAKTILDKRLQNFIIFRIGDKERVLIGKEREAFLNKYPDKIEESKTIKGNVAFKGKAKGEVVVIKTARDLKKIKEGNILVTNMTTPNMIQGMKRAAAFVTDEGGITCHASILARELRKPCIIGTKIATQVLKDGDIVELNADEGVVEVLSGL